MRTALLTVLALAPAARAADAPVFERHVLPILRDHCMGCHGGLHARNDLDLRTRAAALKGGKSGPAVVPGKPDDSLLWRKVAADEMPKGGTPLSADDKAVLKAWVAAGAPGLPPAAAPGTAAVPRAPAAVAADVDREIDRGLAAAKLTAAPAAGDAEFLRRVTLDVTGRIPTADAVRAFLADPDPGKRAKLIDRLLAEPEYGRHFATGWHHLIVPLDAENTRGYNEPFLKWLADGFNAGRGWDQTVAAMLTAEGEPAATPPVAFVLSREEPGPLALQAGKLFLGLDLECAECHNHPTNTWKQKDDYWALAAFFSGFKYNPKRVTENAQLTAGIKIPTSALTSVGDAVKPGFPGSSQPVGVAKAVRPALAKWVTARENPYFAPAAANRLWAHFFGRGLVNPLTDFQPANPPSHPELLALLADEFRASGFDVKHLVRCVCNSKAYGRTSRGGPDGRPVEERFGRMAAKLLTPDVLYDALCRATGHPDLPGLVPAGPPVKSKVKEPPKPARFYFVNRFDQPETPPPPTDYAHGEQQVVVLMNLKALNEEAPLVRRLAESGRGSGQVVEELYLAAVGRPPTPAEAAAVAAYLGRQKDPRQGYRHLLWSLLNGGEFAFNH